MFQTEDRRIWLAPVTSDDSSDEFDWHIRIITRERLSNELRQLLQKQSADRVLLQASSEAQTCYPSDPFHAIATTPDWTVRSHPGVSVAIANSTAPEHLFQQLVLQHRLLLTTTNTQTKRLHRYGRDEKNGVWSIVLPTEGSAAVSVEGLQNNHWMASSDWLLETALRHRLWIELYNDTIERGLQYVVRGKTLPNFKDLVPGFINRPILADPIRMELVATALSNVAWNSDLCEVDHQEICYLRPSIGMEKPLFQTAFPITSLDDSSVQVDYHLYTAMAHTGTLMTRIHTNVPAIVHQHLPPILQPRWASFQARTESGDVLKWDDLLSHEMIFSEDGVHLTYGWNESFSVALQFDPRFWSLDSIPGDPNRGIELPPLWVDFAEGTVSSNTVLLLPPLPDLSMPFNVLSLTCTLYAFIIGSTMSLLIRKASQGVQEDLDPSKKPPGKLKVLKGKLTALRSKLFRKRKVDSNSVRLKGESISSDHPTEDAE